MSKKIVIVGGVAGGATAAARIRTAEDVLEDYDAPLFVYCLSGGRS